MKVRLKAGSARLWLVVTVLPVLLVVWTVIAVLVGPAGPHDPHRPDVDQLAASAPIASADSQASRSMAKLDRALAALPWLSREARSVDDACSSMAYGEFYRRFGPVGCSRTEWNYLAFDGDFLTHTQQINAALRAAGWNSPSGMSTLWKAYPKVGHGTSPRSEQLPFQVVDLPTSLYRSGSLGLQVTCWAERPQVPLFNTPLFSTHRHRGRLPTGGESLARAPRENHPVDGASVVKSAYRHHRYVVVILVSTQYYYSGDKTQEIPTTAGCYSGG